MKGQEVFNERSWKYSNNKPTASTQMVFYDIDIKADPANEIEKRKKAT